MPAEVHCTYCGANAARVASEEVYGRSYGGKVWYCRPCSAWVGVHPDGSPKGTLAKAALRRLRRQFHDAFDPLWRAEVKLLGRLYGRAARRETWHARKRWYAKLAEATGLPVEETHGGRLTEETAPLVLAALKELHRG